MTRRRLVAIVSVVSLLAVAAFVVGGGVLVTQTPRGQEALRAFVEKRLDAAIHGTVHLGRISGPLLTGLTVDTIAIRDERGELFFSSGPITVSYDPRDIADRKIYIRRLDAAHPYIHLREHPDDDWNFQRIFRSEGTLRVPRGPARNFGDYIVIDSARVTRGKVLLSMPWHPDADLRGAARDSAVREALASVESDIRVFEDGFSRTRTWSNASAVLSRARLNDPDSNRFGRVFLVDTLHVDESDPPFMVRNARGEVRVLGDTVSFQAAHFDLPGSTGSGNGRIFWGSGLPVRYDITFRGDSVSLADFTWVHETLPHGGGGKVVVHIENSAEDLRVVNFRLADMDVRSTGSHLRGTMTFGIGAPELIVRDVDVIADPVDFDLLRVFNGGPFPVDWRGQLIGSVKGRGGQLTRFVVDDARGVWRDGHVRGAVSRFAGSGELDILDPAFTRFHGFNVDVGSLDLRSIRHLYPEFPRLRGTISGTATLDSSWMDVRFSQADLRHHDGPGEPTRITGSGRITSLTDVMAYDVTLDARSLSLSALGQSFAALPARGSMRGPIRARGTSPNLELVFNLQGDAGTVTYEGTVEADSVGYAARGSGTFSGLNLREFARAGGLPPSALNGAFEVDLRGDSLANLDGRVSLDIDRSDFNDLRVYPSRARIRFGDGRLVVDTLRLETTAGLVVAAGALGLPGGESDTLHVSVSADSLGGLRPYFASRFGPGTGEGGVVAADSLAGSLSVVAVLTGRLDSLGAAGRVSGNDLFIRKDAGRDLAATFDVRNLLGEPVGAVSVRLDSVVLGGIALDTLGATALFTGRGGTHATFGIGALSANGASARVTGSSERRARRGADHASQIITLDTANLSLGASRWHLARNATVQVENGMIEIDSVVLRDGRTAAVSLAGRMPARDSVLLELAATDLPLEDLAMLLQLERPLAGIGDAGIRVTGTRDRPILDLRAALRDFSMGGVRAERVAASGTYRHGRLDAVGDLFRGGQPAVRANASLPMELVLFEGRLLDDSLRVSVRTDSADLALVEAFVPWLRQGKGRVTGQVEVGGTWSRPQVVGGEMAVHDGEMEVQPAGIRLRGINALVSAVPRADSIIIHRLTAWSGTGPGDQAVLTGGVGLANPREPSFDVTLRARSFRAIDRRGIARLDVSTPAAGVRLTGPYTSAVLRGSLTADRGEIRLPDRELARKQLVDLADTVGAVRREFALGATSPLLQGLRLDQVSVNLGDEVWLRSKEADVKLAGSLNVVSVPSDRYVRGSAGSANGAATYGLALEGELRADRGRYLLDLVAIRRDFQVQRGSITFLGTPDNNPYIDISAQHNVKQRGRQDLGVIVHVRGWLDPGPVLDFSSTESYEISQSDLVSYLMTGHPGWFVGANEETGKAVVTALLPTASSYLTDQLRGTFVGSWVDMLQLHQGVGAEAAETQLTTGNWWLNLMATTRVSGERRLWNNLFVSASAGLCQFQSDQVSFGDAFGLKAEYRITPRFSIEGGREPSVRALLCTQDNLPGVVATPANYNLSFLRTWRF